jgi:peptidoglycan-associated lipoprotein
MAEEETTLQATERSELEELQRQWSLEESHLKSATAEQTLPVDREKFMEEDIYFEKQSSSLLTEAQEILTRKAQWLKQNPQVSAIIQGHSDEPGSAEYNFALGDRRAGNAKSFLIQQGIDPSRLTAVSYGKEKPIDPGNNEEARAKNRRVHFLIEY